MGRKRFFGFVLSVLSFVSFAAKPQDKPYLLLNNHLKKPVHLYLIYNKSKESLWLVHEKKDPGASAGWTSRIDPGRSTVLLMYHPNFKFTCQSVKDHFASRPCDQYLTVTSASDYQIPKKSVGQSYWVVENVSDKTLSDKMSQRGFSKK